MIKILLTFFGTAIAFVLTDMVWLGFIAKNFYRQRLGFILSPDVNWPAAGIFYTLYLAGILYFVVFPAIAGGSLLSAFLNGALLGGLCYATYDLTNMATIAKWPVEVVVVDIIWGMVLTGICSAAGFLVAKQVG